MPHLWIFYDIVIKMLFSDNVHNTVRFPEGGDINEYNSFGCIVSSFYPVILFIQYHIIYIVGAIYHRSANLLCFEINYENLWLLIFSH